MNIFTKPYSSNPWEVIKHFHRDIICAWQRATKGYCFRDLWDIDCWFLDIMPRMLKEFRDKTQGYPNSYNSYEEWIAELDLMIETFNKATEEGKTLNVRGELTKKALTMFVNNFDDLWD